MMMRDELVTNCDQFPLQVTPVTSPSVFPYHIFIHDNQKPTPCRIKLTRWPSAR